MTARMHEELARLLDQARLEAREIPPLTRAHAALSLPEAYAIQAEGIRLRTARGERVVGLKMGLTSEAKRRQMNLDSPVYGVLTDRMQVPAGGMLRLQGAIHPKIEPEIAFRTSRELRGRISREQALDACASVFAAMEILDSRYTDFKYFSLPDVVADNSSSSLFVLGTTERPPARAGPAPAPDGDGGQRRARPGGALGCHLGRPAAVRRPAVRAARSAGRVAARRQHRARRGRHRGPHAPARRPHPPHAWTAWADVSVSVSP